MAGEGSWQSQVRSSAARQWGVVSAEQLRRAGAGPGAVRWAVSRERLFPVCRRVFSVVPPELLGEPGRLAAAVLAGGHGAALCGMTAAAWLGLVREGPPSVWVAVRRALYWRG